VLGGATTDAAGHLSALRLAPAAVFGTSSGATFAFRLTISRPELVRGAVCTSRFWPRSMTTRARAAPDRGGRARALLAPRRRGRELGPHRARPARADAGRAATFFTVEAGAFENYPPDEATLAAVRRRAPRSNYRRGPSGGPAMADPLSPPDRAWSPRARGRPGVPLAGFGDLQLGVDGTEAPDVGGLGRHGLCLAPRSMNSLLLWS
jgi:pimeloyl-ACP methyl ester carboxylesterase